MVVDSVVSFNSSLGGYILLICVLKCLLFVLMRSSIYLNVKLIFFSKVKFFRFSQGIKKILFISI